MFEPYFHSGYFVSTADWDMEEHRHPVSFEISVLMEGRGFLECGGAVYTLEAGHVALIPPNLPHKYRAATKMRFCVLEAGYVTEDTMSLFGRLTPPDRPTVSFLQPVYRDLYDDLFRLSLRISSGALADANRVNRTWTEAIILFLLQHRQEGEINQTVLASADFIRKHLRSELSIAAVARQCGLAESTYRELFKRTFGSSPKQYQQACRESEAKWLLRSTDRPVQWISEQVGFLAVHSFSSWFQKSTGLSPTDYRKQQQGDLDNTLSR